MIGFGISGLLLRALLIGLLSLQAVALRAAPAGLGAPTPAAAGWTLPLCNGGAVRIEGADGADRPAPVSHLDCLDCCLAAMDLTPAPARAPSRSAPAMRLRRRSPSGRAPLARAAPRPRSRAPPHLS
ncbi:MAG: hypothetical protein VYD87_08390 [Pseudomonadota bacterium]|nr:hypothetical protein [Pseudomonadota bacterium]